MNSADRTPDYAESCGKELFPAPEGCAGATSTTNPNPAIALKTIDLKPVANFAILRGELLLAEHEIFQGETPDTFVRLRNAFVALLGRNGKTGLQMGLVLTEIKTALKGENHWVRYGNPIATAMGLKSVSGLNHIIKRTARAAKLPQKLLSALIEQGLEPIDGHNKVLIDKLAARTFKGTDEQAREIVREVQEQITQAKRAARTRIAAHRAKTKDTAVQTTIQTSQSLSEKLLNCPETERMAALEADIDACNVAMAVCLPGYKLQVVPVTVSSHELSDESYQVPAQLAQSAQPVAAETKIGEVQNEDVEDWGEDERFPVYPRVTANQQIKPGDRSGLARLIVDTNGPAIGSSLKGLPPNEQAQNLHYTLNHVVQSCCPAARQGNVIEVSVKFTPPPIQAKRGEPLLRIH